MLDYSLSVAVRGNGRGPQYIECHMWVLKQRFRIVEYYTIASKILKVIMHIMQYVVYLDIESGCDKLCTLRSND